MNEKNLSSSLDDALVKVNPDRRRFLGMMLAGAAALPLLSSTELTVPASAQASGAIPAPTIKPGTTQFTCLGRHLVTMSDTQPGVAIYYTTDGTTPTAKSTPYKAQGFQLDLNMPGGHPVTIKAIAVAGGNSSPVTTVTYTPGTNLLAKCT
jgi:hypothetical protein